MAFQGEQEPGVLEMDVELVESMAQDENPEQEMLVVQEQFPPQPNPEPEMGAAAAEAAVYDIPPSPPPPKPPDPFRIGSVERTRHGPAIRHSGRNQWGYARNERRYATKGRRNERGNEKKCGVRCSE